MRLPWHLLWMLMIVLANSTVIRAAAPAAGTSPIATRQNIFAIPFRVDGGTDGHRAVEVQLHVSEDQGTTWKLQSKVQPAAARFDFRAPHDGQYWFMVRTLDDRGIVRPSGPPAPELKVLVDTAQPKLELEASRGEAGELRARWRTRDPNLRIDSLTVSYRSAGANDAWQPVAVDPLRPDAGSGWFVGEATWWPESAGVGINVRVEVVDLAGNTTASQARVDAQASPAAEISPPAATNPALPVISPLPPTTTAPPAAPIEPPVSESSSAPTQTPAWQSPPPPTSPTTTQSASIPPASQQLPAASRGTAASELEQRPESVPWPSQPVSEPLARQGAPQMPSAFPAAVAPRESTAVVTPPASVPPARATPEPRVASRVEPVAPMAQSANVVESPATKPMGHTATTVANKPAAEVAPAEMPAADAPAKSPVPVSPPPGVRPRMVNSRRFELGYDIDSLGRDAVSKVELWGTRDGGNSWRKFGTDTDNRSPMIVTLDGEGLFGFRVVVETKTGLRGAPPAAGDLPDVWVGVDTTKPTARLLSIDPSPGSDGSELTVRWTAEDRLLAARPITLSFATAAQGPWTVLASGLENTGQYRWRLDPRLPPRLYVRLEVSDEAGNRQVVETPEPVQLIRTRPQGRIRDVRPVSEARKSADATR